MDTLVSRDVWSEILRYFRVSFEDDTTNVVRLKQQVIFSVALTCSALAEVALDELWRSMTTLEPVIRVFSSFPGSLKNGFEYTDDGAKEFRGILVNAPTKGSGDDRYYYWKTAISPGKVISHMPRVHSYLNRIHHLLFTTFPSKREYRLWQALQNIGGVSILCPNLKGFSLKLHPNDTPGMMSHLFLFISPSITTVTFFGDNNLRSASVLLDTLNIHNAQLLEVSFLQGSFSVCHFFQSATQFSSLRSLVLKNTDSREEIEAENHLDATHIEALQHLTHLKTLAIDMSLVNCSMEQTLQTFGRYLTNLSSLELIGTWKEIHTCLFSCSVTFGSLISLSLYFDKELRGDTSRPKHPSSNLLSLVSSTCPIIESPFIGGPGPDIHGHLHDPWSSITGTSMDDIFELKEKNLKCIHLVHFSPPPPMCLVRNVLMTWPMLERLSIMLGDLETEWDLGSLFSIGPVIGTCLEKLYLPLSLRSLATAPTTLTPFKGPLRTLGLHNPRDIPGSLKEKHVVARNLIALFPRLTVIETSLPGDSSNGHIQDLQMIIDALRDCIAFPSGRPDFLYY